MLIYKIFLFLLFFSKYLTWIIQIRTCWGEAGCCFYSHLFRESTENILQHGHPEPKKRKHGTFFFFLKRKTFRSPRYEEFLVAGWLAGQWAPHLYLSASDLVIRHRAQRSIASSLACLEQGVRQSTWKPWFTCLQLTLWWTLNYMTKFVWLSPITLEQISVVVEEMPGGLFFIFNRKIVPLRVQCCHFWVKRKKSGRTRIIRENLLRDWIFKR